MPPQESIPLVARAQRHPTRTALIAPGGELSYRALLDRSSAAASRLLDGAADLDGARVAFLTPPGMDYAITQWGIWRAGGVAVPLCTAHPAPELAHVIDDSGASILVAGSAFADRLRPLSEARGRVLILTGELRDAGSGTLPRVASQRDAMLIYTSGTTGRPKGAVSTHDILAAQIRSLVEAWAWSPEDHVLHVLPLHHLHGILNLLCCALWSGATCEIQRGFDARAVWERICSSRPLTLFMAVPTIYQRLAREWEASPPDRRRAMRRGCERMRLMVSGSAALPVQLFERWREISGHTLLERYGMTEIGMGLSNPLQGERVPGHVGSPLPGVDVRLQDESGAEVEDGVPGRIQVRGPTLFKEYWNRPRETAESFTADGWFETGDIAVRSRGIYRILGRESVDILKTGGYKVSALEIEGVLGEHAAIAECAVVGVADEEWGQRVAAAIVLQQGSSLDLEALRAWGVERLAPYKVPTLVRHVDELPRNPMGKVIKSDVVRLFADR